MQRINLLLFLVLILALELGTVFAQTTPPPKAGEYSCFSLTYRTTPEMQWRLNPITNQLEMVLGVGSGTNLLPAPFNIVLDGKSRYSMTNTKGKGTYSYNSEKSSLTFTGDITFLTFLSYGLAKTGEYIINFNDKKTGVPYVCQLGGSNKNGTTNASTTPIGQPKVRQHPLFSYKPSSQNNNPKFTEAFSYYQRTMDSDIDNFNDVAAAFAYIVSINYMFYHQQRSVSTSQTQKIYDQFVEKLLLDENFKKATNETKQQLAEVVIMDGLESYKARETLSLDKCKEVSLKILRKYLGNAADKLKITDNGMEF